jgi:hypothetical protein
MGVFEHPGRDVSDPSVVGSRRDRDWMGGFADFDGKGGPSVKVWIESGFGGVDRQD